MKISYPMMLGDLFKKYSSLEYIPADGEYGSPNESSKSPSKKGSRMNVDSSYQEHSNSKVNYGSP
jgi:hypothetical protein